MDPLCQKHPWVVKSQVLPPQLTEYNFLSPGNLHFKEALCILNPLQKIENHAHIIPSILCVSSVNSEQDLAKKVHSLTFSVSPEHNNDIRKHTTANAAQ